MKNKKGQAAMEFLMTYGWAILAAIIVVGVLWFLIGDPANLVGNTIKISAPLVANAVSINTTSIQIEIRNGAMDAITVTNIKIGTCSLSPATSVAAGTLMAFTIPCAQTSGSRVNSDVTLSYTTAGSSVTQQATGSVSGRVP